jgi:uncharacterized phage protein (TIGR01671 family)
MRTIKFSVWDPNHELMHYNIGLDKIHLYIFDGDNITEQEGLIIREWTGLTDRNGKEIYEGDVLATTNENGSYPDYDHWNKEDFGYTVVEWDSIYTCFQGSNWMWEMNRDDESVYNIRFVEVIGNKYANPELVS